jgi:hypothetical protein
MSRDSHTIDGGLFGEIAYMMSDFHIQHIEELKEIKHMERAVMDALTDFAGRVRKNKDEKVSKTVAICQNYIFNHLYEPITLAALFSTTRATSPRCSRNSQALRQTSTGTTNM